MHFQTQPAIQLVTGDIPTMTTQVVPDFVPLTGTDNQLFMDEAPLRILEHRVRPKHPLHQRARQTPAEGVEEPLHADHTGRRGTPPTRPPEPNCLQWEKSPGGCPAVLMLRVTF